MKVQLMHAGEAGLLVIAAVIIGAIELTKRARQRAERRTAEAANPGEEDLTPPDREPGPLKPKT